MIFITNMPNYSVSIKKIYRYETYPIDLTSLSKVLRCETCPIRIIRFRWKSEAYPQ